MFTGGDKRHFSLCPACIILVTSTHPVWQITDSLISHKLQYTTVCHSVWVLVGQLEQHWIGDVEPACGGEKWGGMSGTYVGCFQWRETDWLNLHLLSWSRAEGGIITEKKQIFMWDIITICWKIKNLSYQCKTHKLFFFFYFIFFSYLNKWCLHTL